MVIRKAELKDVPELLNIYNYEVEHGVSTLDLEPRTLQERTEWFYQHNTGHHPLYVAELQGQVAGYVSLSTYREKEAYRSTVELSIYIGPGHRKQGLATALMDFIIQEARKDDTIHNIVSVITTGNEASEKLHEKFGFQFCGTIREVGVKFGKYQDIDNYSLILR